MIITKEYLSVTEISKICDMTARNVRKIIMKIRQGKSIDMLFKDALNRWNIHHLLLPEFKRKRTKSEKHFALTIDPCDNYTRNDLDTIIKYIYEETNDSEMELNYTIEEKKSNKQNHIHCYIKGGSKKDLLQSIKLAFSRTSYHESDIYDLEGWKNYITKDGNAITTLKN